MVDDVERLNHERVIERSFYTNSGVERILSSPRFSLRQKLRKTCRVTVFCYEVSGATFSDCW